MAVESVSSALPASAILGPSAISALAASTSQTDVLALTTPTDAQSSAFVSLSDSGQLLSALADLSLSSDADSVSAAQNFVELFNNSSDITSSQAVASLFDSAAVDTTDTAPDTVVTTPVQDALSQLGITVQSVNTTTGTIELQLNTQVLNAAVATDAAGTSDQLADVAGVIEATILAAQQSAGLPAAATDVQTGANNGTSAITPVVPDLTEINNALRRGLAATALEDAIVAANSQTPVLASELESPLLQIAPAVNTSGGVDTTAAADIDSTSTAAVTPPQTPTSAAPATTDTTDVTAVINTTNTSFEQANLIATNPATASSVAAFNLMDNGLRVARTVNGPAPDVVNPVQTIKQTEAIAPNLPNSSNENQRRQFEQTTRQPRVSVNRLAA